MITKLQITSKLHYHRKCDFQLSKRKLGYRTLLPLTAPMMTIPQQAVQIQQHITIKLYTVFIEQTVIYKHNVIGVTMRHWCNTVDCNTSDRDTSDIHALYITAKFIHFISTRRLGALLFNSHSFSVHTSHQPSSDHYIL